MQMRAADNAANARALTRWVRSLRDDASPGGSTGDNAAVKRPRTRLEEAYEANAVAAMERARAEAIGKL